MIGYLLEVRARLPSAGIRLVFTLAAFLGAFAVAPTLLGPPAREQQPQSRVDQLYAEHACAPASSQDRTMLLISTPTGVGLVPVATTPDEQVAQTDWLYDQHADFYGWCHP